MTTSFRVRLLSALSVAAVVGSMFGATASQAQHFRPGQELGRLLGVGVGNGYHCRTPGPNVDYYNPWSAANSHLVSRYQDTGSYPGAYGEMQGMSDQTQFIPHRVYTGRTDGYSIFESVPGQTLMPTFEPIGEGNRSRNGSRDANEFDDFGGDRSEFESRAREEDRSMDDDQRSPMDDDYRDDSGGFQELQDNFDAIERDDPPLPRSGSKPAQEDQVRFFGN